MKGYILALDQGTTGSTALIINCQTKKIEGQYNKEFPQIYPKPGWVEHNLNDIWESMKESIEGAIKKSGINPSDILSIGITNQRETTCAFNNDGVPFCHAIVWQDRRTEEFCLKNKDHEALIKEKTGLPLDPYFSASKMNWIKKNVLNHSKEKVLFGTIDTYLLFKLTQGKSYFTETSNASRTMLMNLKTGYWDSELLSLFDIHEEELPVIKNSIDSFGSTLGLGFLPDGIQIQCMLGDQQAALFGQAGQDKGDFKCTYGTGAFALANTGYDVIHTNDGLITTAAYSYEGKIHYALEGATYIAGASVQWLRDNLNFFEKSHQIEELAKKATDESTENLIFLPFFTGIASPYWISNAKASIIGLTRDTSKEQISRACLEGIAMSINDLIQTFQKNSEVKTFSVDGGATQNEFLLQTQANFSKVVVNRPSIIETTAFGVALGCLVKMGVVKMDELKSIWKLDKSFSPQENLTYYEKKYSQWNRFIQAYYLS